MMDALISRRTLYNFSRRVLLLLRMCARSGRSEKVVSLLIETWLMMTVMNVVYMNYEHDIDLKSFISASLLSYSLGRDRHCNA